MSNYRPICDVWLLARPKVPYYGAYPAGFLHRARALLGVWPADAVLHVCAGRIRDYPMKGLGKNDRTLDLDENLKPDFLQDARAPFPLDARGDQSHRWAAVLIDPPYTEEDATHYAPGREVLPTPNQLLRHAIAVLQIGGRCGILHYLWPQPPKNAIEVAVIAVATGRNNRARWFTVFERTA